MPEIADLLFPVHCNQYLSLQPQVCSLDQAGTCTSLIGCWDPHLAPTLGTGSTDRHSITPDYSPTSWASPTSFNYLQHLEKLLEALLLDLVCFTCVPPCSSLSLKICQSFQKQELFSDKARFLAHSSSIPLNIQSANNITNTCLPPHYFLTLIYERSV